MRLTAIVIYRALGAAVGIGIMEALGQASGEPMSRIPFVTSIVLAMALPDSEPAQPRAIIGGHLFSTLAGLLVVALLGRGEAASAAAVGFATVLMMGTKTLHPPAGIDAFMVASYGLPAVWVLNPVLIGAVLLACFALAWRWLEHFLFDEEVRRDAPQMWSRERVRALTRPWRARR